MRPIWKVNGQEPKLGLDDLLEALQAAKEARDLLEKICDANGPYDKPWVVPDDVRKRLVDLSGFDDSE